MTDIVNWYKNEGTIKLLSQSDRSKIINENKSRKLFEKWKKTYD